MANLMAIGNFPRKFVYNRVEQSQPGRPDLKGSLVSAFCLCLIFLKFDLAIEERFSSLNVFVGENLLGSQAKRWAQRGEGQGKVQSINQVFAKQSCLGPIGLPTLWFGHYHGCPHWHCSQRQSAGVDKGMDGETDGRTDRETKRQTDRQTERARD